MPATGGIASVAGFARSYGYGKQSAWGTGVTPTNWWKWLDGTSFDEDKRLQVEREGDTTPHPSLAYTAAQMVTGRVVEEFRPRTGPCSIAALFGNGSDTYTAPAFTTTVGTGGMSAGDTTVKLTADEGNTGSVPININPGDASATYEVVTIDKTTRTGAGPYVYTIAASGTLKFAHTAGEAVTAASTHVFTRQTGVYDPFTVEEGFGVNGTTPYEVLRYIDSVCNTVEISHDVGRVLRSGHGWYAASIKRQASLTAPVLEGQGQVGLAGAPFHFSQARGSWNLDGSTASTTNAVTIRSMRLSMKNGTSPDDHLLQGVNPSYFTMDDFDVQCQLDVEFQSFDQYYETYFGNTKTPSSSATDSYLVGYGSLSVTYTADAVNTLTISLPYCAYTAAKKPQPSLGGKPVRQQLVMTPMKSLSVSQPVTITVTNSRNSAY